MATIRKRGNRFHVQIRKRGFPSITKTFSDRKTAETFIKGTKKKMERGVFLDSSLADATTVHELLERYRSEILPAKKGAVQELGRITILNRELGQHKLGRLQPFIISGYLKKRLSVVKPVTAKRELAILSHALNVAEKDFGIFLPHGNPVSRIRLPSTPRGRERRPSIRELEALCSDSTVGKAVTYATESGMRRGEIARMEWKHVNWKAQTLYIPDTKTDIPRTIPLSKKAIETLRSLPRRIDGQVWGMQPDSITQAFNRACRRYNIQDLRFHDLRHEATSRFFEKGLNVMEVASITGHQDLRMLRRYTHIRPETLVARL